MHTQGMAAPTTSAPPARHASSTSDPVFGVALLDRSGNLLGASTSSSLPGELEVPSGTDLRRQDLRSYFVEGRSVSRARSFPLVSATWVQVKSRRIRVGIYMEKGERSVNPERLELDLGAVAAIIGGQLVA